LTAPQTSRADSGPLGLAGLIDVEVCLRADRERPLSELIERDREITARIDTHGLDDRALIGAWVRLVRSPGSVGTRAERFWRMLLVGLFALGLVVGFSGAAAWLATDGGTPVNIVVLWPVLIGLPALFAGGWFVAALPGRWLDRVPGVASLRELLAAVSSWIPTAIGAVIARVAGREARGALAELRRIDLLYGRLRFWLLTSLTQAFALAFSLGAAVALIGLPYVDDPAFGWRSRLMTTEQLHAAAGILATPWVAVAPEALPSREQVAQTRYSSVDPRFARGPHAPGEAAIWGAWWPFLVASILVYGLGLRLATLTASFVGMRRALRRTSLDDAECRRLVARLRHTLETRGEGNADAAAASAVMLTRADASALAGHRVLALRWAGEALSPQATCAEITAATKASEVAFGGEVGGLDPNADTATLRDLPDSDQALALVVDGWEWPVSDHGDFLRALRRTLGTGRAVWVLLRSGPAATSTLDVWRARLAALGDPWLNVAELS
jgi:hypothetical protein